MEIFVISETKTMGNGIIEFGNGHVLVGSEVGKHEGAQTRITCTIHRDKRTILNSWEAFSEKI